MSSSSSGWKNSGVVREQDRYSSRRLWIWACIWLLALSPLGIYLFEQMHYSRVRMALEDLENQKANLEEQERVLKLTKSKLEALAQVEHQAKELGLKFPEADQRIQVLETPNEQDLMVQTKVGLP